MTTNESNTVVHLFDDCERIGEHEVDATCGTGMGEIEAVDCHVCRARLMSEWFPGGAGLATKVAISDRTTVERLLNLPIGADDDGRSEWQWLRLANGDLMVGFFPQGDGYMEFETTVEADWQAACLADEDWHGRVIVAPFEDVLP